MQITIDDTGALPHQDMTTHALINEHVMLQQKLTELQAWAHGTEFSLIQRLLADGASEATSNTHKAEIKQSTSYDKGILHGMFELVERIDLIDAGAYKPAHKETADVAADWNMTYLKKFGKRGQAIKDLIERAKKLGRPRLKVTALRSTSSQPRTCGATWMPGPRHGRTTSTAQRPPSTVIWPSI